MEDLRSEQRREAVRIESEEFRERLHAAGAVGVRRAVRIRASAGTPAGAPLGDGEKRVHFIRHGQGFHNLLADLYREVGKPFNSATGDGGEHNPYKRPEVRDAPLTELGRGQARQLQPSAKALAAELVVTSPMVRATQTALLAFSHLLDGTTTKVPFVAHEGCHEIAGVHTCDWRRDLAELRADFPMVDYTSAAIVEKDPTWNETVREPLTSLADRGYEFLLWLRDRPEKDVVVVSHFGWLFTLMNAVVECDDPKLKLGWLTCEMRSFCMRYEDGDAPDAKRPRGAAP